MHLKPTAKAALIGMSLGAFAALGASAKTLVYCSEGSPEGFDPALYTAGTTFDASAKPIYNRLVEFARPTTNVEPALAERWNVSDDGLRYTFELRSGVPFQTTDYFDPTRPLNADDVIFSFERQLKSDHPWYDYQAGAAWEYAQAMGLPELIHRIERLGDRTVTFHLTRPDFSFLANLAMDFSSIVSKEYADQLEAERRMLEFNQRPIGTGPFEFVDYQPDAAIRYRANEDYWKGKQPIDDLVFAITNDPTARMEKLLAGECHVISYPSPADVASLKSNPDLQVMEQEGLNIGYLAYNAQERPFDDPRVRKALNMAIDKRALVDAVFQGTGTVAKNPIPPTMWSYNDSIEDDPYDPEAARRLLREAGVTGLKTKIWAMPVQRPYNPNGRRTAELIKTDFARIGVDAEIVSYDWAEYLNRSKDVDREGAVLLGWTGDNGDPDNFLGVLLSCDGVGGSNRAQWCNADYDSLVAEAKRVTIREQRERLYREAQAVFKREAPWATLAHSLVFMPMRKEVSGYVMDPLGAHVFEGVNLIEPQVARAEPALAPGSLDLPGAVAARDERRIALVIGNSAYSRFAPLPNPINDANAVKTALEQAGFDAITMLHDANQGEILKALHKFSREAETADWAVVFYSGHGIEVGGANYLIPVDASLEIDRDVEFEAVKLDQVLASVEGARKLRVVFLDACRQNPFIANMRRQIATRSVGRGLARVEPQQSGSLVVFAAREGEVALDGDGANSPFTTSLVKYLPVVGLEINKLLRFVRDDVLAATDGQQEPFIYQSISSEDYFFAASQQ